MRDPIGHRTGAFAYYKYYFKDKIPMRRNLIVLVLSLTICFLVLVSPFVYFLYTNFWKYNANFEDYKAEFTLVKNYVTQEIQEKTTEKGYFSVSFPGGDTTEKHDLFDPDKGEHLNCPEEVRDALETLCKEAFYHKDSVLDVIRYNQNMIAFVIENGHYLLVYSPGGTPKDLWNPDYDDEIVCKRIEDDWYHVRIK